MTFSDSSVWLEDGSIVIRNRRLINSSVTSDANFGSPAFIFEYNDVIGGSVNGWGSRSRILGNDIRDGSILMPVSDGMGPSGLVAGNLLHNGNILVGDGQGTAFNVQLVRNDVSGYIKLSANDSLIYANVIRGCGPNQSSLELGLGGNIAFRNRLVANDFAGGCEHGIYFSDFTRDNVYSDNIFHEYSLDSIVDYGVRNHSEHDIEPQQSALDSSD